MADREQTYYLRWGLLVLGITGWAIAATLVDRALSHSRLFASPQTDAPAFPPLPLVVPADRVLDTTPVDFGAELSLPSPAVEAPPDSTALASVVVPQHATPTDIRPRARPAVEPAPAPPSPSGSPARRTPRTRGLPITYDGQLRAYRGLERRPGVKTSLELGGLVVDETMSPHGRLFYTAFFDVWQAPPVDGFYTVRILEKPTPGRGTMVQVFVNDDITFRTRLQPQTEIDRQALQAARRTYAYVRSGQGILRIH